MNLCHFVQKCLIDLSHSPTHGIGGLKMHTLNFIFSIELNIILINENVLDTIDLLKISFHEIDCK